MKQGACWETSTKPFRHRSSVGITIKLNAARMEWMGKDGHVYLLNLITPGGSRAPDRYGAFQ